MAEICTVPVLLVYLVTSDLFYVDRRNEEVPNPERKDSSWEKG